MKSCRFYRRHYHLFTTIYPLECIQTYHPVLIYSSYHHIIVTMHSIKHKPQLYFIMIHYTHGHTIGSYFVIWQIYQHISILFHSSHYHISASMSSFQQIHQCRIVLLHNSYDHIFTSMHLILDTYTQLWCIHAAHQLSPLPWYLYTLLHIPQYSDCYCWFRYHCHQFCHNSRQYNCCWLANNSIWILFDKW